METAGFDRELAETPAAMEEWLLPLVEAGVDIVHCSQRRFWEAEFPEIDGVDGLNFAGWAKRVTGATTISVGSVGLEKDFATTSPARVRHRPASIASSNGWSGTSST